jgi:hypothetical protein
MTRIAVFVGTLTVATYDFVGPLPRRAVFEVPTGGDGRVELRIRGNTDPASVVVRICRPNCARWRLDLDAVPFERLLVNGVDSSGISVDVRACVGACE